MQKLSLHYENILQGAFSPGKLNFLFVFQVNCPGCFIYGFPLVNKLFEVFKEEVSFLGISTAFEDFEYNNIKNTQLLVEENKVVGETKKMLEQQGLDIYPTPINFPIVMDKITDTSFDFDAAARQICLINPNYTIWPEFEQKAVVKKVILYLKKLEVLSQTFTLNQLRGTPSFIVFNNDFEILHHQFGHIEYEAIKKRLETLIDI